MAGAIVSISAAAGVLIRIYKHFRKPGETQDHRIAELERKSVNDYNRLNDLDNGMQRLEGEIKLPNGHCWHCWPMASMGTTSTP